MRILLFLLILIHSVPSSGQSSFEGVIIWAVSNEITDPYQLKELKKAQEKMSTAEFEAMRKEAMAVLDQPEYRDYPELKEQTEAILKIAVSGGHINFMLPTAYMIKLRKNDSNTRIVGGVFGGLESLSLQGKDSVYMLNRISKIFFPVPPTNSVQPLEKPTITKTTETDTLLGYTCEKYVVQSKLENRTLTQIFWMTTAIKNLTMATFTQNGLMSNPKTMAASSLKGFPLKIEVINADGKMTFEVKKIQPQQLKEEDFTIPADFKRTKMF